MASFRKKQNVNVGRVVTKVTVTVIALYAGGIVMDSVGDVMNCTQSGFYDGLTLIGWTITDGLVLYDNASDTQCAADFGAGTFNNVITDVSGTGILAVIGVLGIASIVMEFVEFKV